MKEEWANVTDLTDEAIRVIMKEEGVPEEEIGAEIKKLRDNQSVTVQTRAVLITPEVDETLKAIFEFAKLHIFGSDNNDKLDRVKEALWPQ